MKVEERLIRHESFAEGEVDVHYRTSEEGPGMLYYAHFAPGVHVENGILCEQDVPVTLRDGTVIYTDVYRPEGATDVPAIVAWSPYGKRHGYAPKGRQAFLALGVPPGTTSPMAKFEGPDPAYWCHLGYAVVNPDARGAGHSEGNLLCVGTQDGRDAYDLIEWVAAQTWSNGKVGMSGNSWLAMVQWYTAAEKPPHLACIAPFEGCSDVYREFICTGGIPEPGFNEFLLSGLRSESLIEDWVAMARTYPLMNPYWDDKVARFEDIEVPAYITGGWSHFHLRGATEAFRRIASPRKWLRIHRDFEWPDAVDPQTLEDLRRFFDRYLKDIRNGWEMTPRVRLDVMDAYDVDFATRRAEGEFPLARTVYTPLYLAPHGRLSPETVEVESSVSYDAAAGETTFDVTFEHETEVTGYLKLRLWVEAQGSEDMDLFVAVQKLDRDGRFVPTLVLGEPYPGTPGLMRVSHRELDESLSTPDHPHHTHRHEQLLGAGEVVSVEVEIYPTSRIWHPGEQLRVVVSGRYQRHGWFEPFAWDTRNRGRHVIHLGGPYDSHLLVPIVPPRLSADGYVRR